MAPRHRVTNSAEEPRLGDNHHTLAGQKAIPPGAPINLPQGVDRLIVLCLKWDKPDEVTRWRAERQKYPLEIAPPAPGDAALVSDRVSSEWGATDLETWLVPRRPVPTGAANFGARPLSIVCHLCLCWPSCPSTRRSAPWSCPRPLDVFDALPQAARAYIRCYEVRLADPEARLNQNSSNPSQPRRPTARTSSRRGGVRAGGRTSRFHPDMTALPAGRSAPISRQPRGLHDG